MAREGLDDAGVKIVVRLPVEELLEFDEDSAGGMMSRDYVALPRAVTVGEALTDLHSREELPETLNTLFLVDPAGKLTGAVALAKLFLSSATMPVEALAMEPLICVPEDESKDRITELFDKYNLLTLPVVDEEERLSGVITADEIITALRQK